MSPQGDPKNPGTKAKPVPLPTSNDSPFGDLRRRMYVCGGAYTGEVIFTGKGAASQDHPVKVYGGFSCADWRYDGSRPKLVGPDPFGSRKALTIKDFKSGFELVDFEIQARDAKSSGDTPSAMLVMDSTDVVFRRVTVTGGNALSAPAGVNGSPPTIGTVLDGQAPLPSTPAKGGLQVYSYCDSSTPASYGGKGGDATSGPQGNGGNGTATPPAPASPGRDGAGGVGGTTTCNPGNSGADGAAKPAASGAQTSGKLTSHASWIPSEGAVGGWGNVGQGGGGGSAGGGGSGASGGCRGGGGGGGRSGDSTFAVVSIRSSLKLESSSIHTGNAGAGGAGGVGASGKGGGKRSAGGACIGGFGGNGAGGGGGGGGAGGLSVGIGYVGEIPVLDSATAIVLGQAGRGGPGGAGGAHGVNDLGTGTDGQKGTDGKPGVAAATMELPFDPKTTVIAP